jgi:hypothetical protein
MSTGIMFKLTACLILCLILLSACNNREDILLPPNLSAADYLSGNKIESYANYLVKSANDNSYFLLDKLAIADSLLSIGDVLDFRKVKNFSARDSLALQDNATAISQTYRLTITRAGQTVNLISRIPLGQVYTELQACDAPYMINFAYYLQATEIQPANYGIDRAYFPLFTTGEFAVYNIPVLVNASITFNTITAVHALLQDTSGKQLAVNFPAAYCAAAGLTTISMSRAIEINDYATLQRWYPNAAISTPIINVQTTSPVGSEIAVLMMKDASKGFFGEQWVRLASPMAYSWQSTNADSQINNWWQNSTGLYSFVAGSGSYFLLTPLDTQTELDIPLDGSFNQVFLQELWFDLQGMNLPHTVMNVKFNPNITSTLNDYFNGKPFTINGNYQAFGISFLESGSLIEQLPNDAWLEFGFRTTLTNTANDRFFTLFRNTSRDVITYKSPSDTYDAEHYSRTGNYVYTGMNTSATYLYGSFSESQNELVFPYLKGKQYIQTSQAVVNWSDTAKRGYSELRLNLNPSVPPHPWLSGEPLQLTFPEAITHFSFYQGSTEQSTLATGFNLSLPYSGTASNMLLFNNLAYPRIKLYHSSTAIESDTYVVSNGNLSIYPEYPGTLISAGVYYPNPASLRVYPTMTFVLDDLRFYTYGNAPAGKSALFSILKKTTQTDQFNILHTQYSIVPTSPAYEITTADEANYTSFQPMLFFKRSRSRNLLFYERTGTPYRLYPYSESSSFDPYYFLVDGGYNGISLAYNGSYASYSENTSHTSVSSIIKAYGQDVHLSLYQAQFVLPSLFLEGTVPQNTTIKLDKISSIPGATDLLAAYQLLFTQPNGMPVYPDFYNVLGATQEPYIYIPITNISAIPGARLFYRNLFGQISELTRVQNFSDNYASEYTVLGNCFICTVPNPGIFYVIK